MALTIAAYLWLISLPFLLYFYIRLGKSKPLNSEERLLAWTGVVLFILSVGFQSMEWFGITPAFLIPYASNIVYSLVLVGAVAIALLVGRRTKKPQGSFAVERSGMEGAQVEETKLNLRSGIAAEMYSILKKFTDPLNHLDISHLIWSGKFEQSKATILGIEDYVVLRSFYDALEERNKYFAGRRGWNLQTLDPLNRKCVETLSRAYSEVTWLKTASDTDSLLSKARKSVGLPSAEQSSESAPLVMKISDRSYDAEIAARLDPAFAGVHALFFWPKECSWQKGEREPTINMPYTKVIIKGTEAFWWGAYAEELFRKGKIEYNNAPGDFEGEDDMVLYLRENGFNLHKQPVSPKDLLESSSQ